MVKLESVKRYIRKNGGQKELKRLLSKDKLTTKQLERINTLHENNKKRVGKEKELSKARSIIIENNMPLPKSRSGIIKKSKSIQKQLSNEKEYNKFFKDLQEYNKHAPFSKKLSFTVDSEKALEKGKLILKNMKSKNFNKVKELLKVSANESIRKASLRLSKPSAYKDKSVLETLSTKSNGFNDLFKGASIDFVKELQLLNFTINEFVYDKKHGGRDSEVVAYDLLSTLPKMSTLTRERVEQFLKSKGYLNEN